MAYVWVLRRAILRPDAPFISLKLESKNKTESNYGSSEFDQSSQSSVRVQSFYSSQGKTANQLDSLILTGPILL